MEALFIALGYFGFVACMALVGAAFTNDFKRNIWPFLGLFVGAPATIILIGAALAIVIGALDWIGRALG